MPTKRELVADGRSLSEIQKELGCDALFYQRLEDLIWAAKEGNPEISSFDCSCFDGNYVTGSVSESYLDTLDVSNRAIEKMGSGAYLTQVQSDVNSSSSVLN